MPGVRLLHRRFFRVRVGRLRSTSFQHAEKKLVFFFKGIFLLLYGKHIDHSFAGYSGPEKGKYAFFGKKLLLVQISVTIHFYLGVTIRPMVCYNKICICGFKHTEIHHP